jgi:hypothetical protein
MCVYTTVYNMQYMAQKNSILLFIELMALIIPFGKASKGLFI